MDIQRKMRAIKRDVVFKCDPKLPAQRTSYWLQSWPEQTVMHDQKIDVLFCSLDQNARRNINRRTDACDPAGIFDLKTVKRIIPIAHVANPQKVVGVTDNLGKRRHEASVGAFVPNAEAKHARRAEHLYTATAKIIIRPSMPRTSCGGSS